MLEKTCICKSGFVGLTGATSWSSGWSRRGFRAKRVGGGKEWRGSVESADVPQPCSREGGVTSKDMLFSSATERTDERMQEDDDGK
jgi:hypothetical protein